MRYKTVKDVIKFVSGLSAEDIADTQLQINVEFYHGKTFVGEFVKKMYSEYTATALKSDVLLDYVVTDFKIEVRSYCIAFVLSIKELSSI